MYTLPTQIEALALEDSEIIAGDEDKPLLAFAVAACWVIQTLAQYAAEASDAWIELANDVASLVHLASRAPEDEHSAPLIKELLWSLISIYESLRQCEEAGYITQQLAYDKYDHELRRLLRADWREQKTRLKHRVATCAMALVVYQRRLDHLVLGQTTRPEAAAEAAGAAAEASLVEVVRRKHAARMFHQKASLRAASLGGKLAQRRASLTSGLPTA